MVCVRPAFPQRPASRRSVEALPEIRVGPIRTAAEREVPVRRMNPVMRQSAWRIALLMVLLTASCGTPSSSLPAVPSVPSSATASPSVGPASPAASETTSGEINQLLASMAGAVLARDRTAYMALMDQSDPVFALEHGRWADEWSGPKPVSQYILRLADVIIDGEAATGQLTVHWQLRGSDEPRAAMFAAKFTHTTNGGWRYAGERWLVTDAPHFHVLVAPGLEATVPGIIADLPAIYDHVTTTLGVVPAGSMQIKEYLGAEALVANTLLSLPNIRGWNEPGEALKLRADPADPSQELVIAHEFTHFVLFDRAGTHRTRMPWWLDEGVASFIASKYEGPDATDRIAQVAAWEASGELAAWDDMAVFETTPLELWTFAYPQGYAMTRYVTERYGDDKRNAWLAKMATEMTIDQATPAVLGLSFDDLDVAFRAWLASKRT